MATRYTPMLDPKPPQSAGRRPNSADRRRQRAQYEARRAALLATIALPAPGRPAVLPPPPRLGEVPWGQHPTGARRLAALLHKLRHEPAPDSHHAHLIPECRSC